MTSCTRRDGTVLIIVSGISALLASLCLALVLRMRGDGESSTAAAANIQARIMLMAACDYVLEGSRLGYDPRPNSAALSSWTHREGFGWIDVRDGSIGPRDQDTIALFNTTVVEDGNGDGASDRPAWPAQGSVARCPMYVMQRPPFATQLTATYNPMATDENDVNNFAMPYLRNPDPQPVSSNNWSAADPDAVNASAYDVANGYCQGDTRPVANSQNIAWFRVFRDRTHGARFIITCGAGGSGGFKDWNEVVGMQAQALFAGDRLLFEDLQNSEVRLWYAIEWSASVAGQNYHAIDNEINPGYHPADNYYWYPVNISQCSSGRTQRSQIRSPNLGGTIRWVQRLQDEPAEW